MQCNKYIQIYIVKQTKFKIFYIVSKSFAAKKIKKSLTCRRIYDIWDVLLWKVLDWSIAVKYVLFSAFSMCLPGRF